MLYSQLWFTRTEWYVCSDVFFYSHFVLDDISYIWQRRTDFNQYNSCNRSTLEAPPCSNQQPTPIMWYPHDIGFVRFQFIGSSPRQKKKKRKDPWPLLSGEKLFGPPFLPDPSWYRGKQCGTWQANGLMLPLRTLQGALSLCSLNGMFRGHT